MTSTPYGFRVVGSPLNDRRLVDWQRAFVAYCQCDDRADVGREAYLSAFTFGADFRRHLETTGSTKGYNGSCGALWLWFDIDREGNLDAATLDARRLAAALIERYRLDGDELLAFFSGAKGYHLGAPLSLCGSPAPSVTFNATARRFAERLADLVGVTIDPCIYATCWLFRAPNSRHSKTGRHKRRLTFDELLHLRTDAILRLAATPETFDSPPPSAPNPQAVADWTEAAGQAARTATAMKERNANGSPRLNKGTLAVIRGELAPGGFGADEDKRRGVGRHRLLFSSAANLAELGCPRALAHELLTEAGLDSGLSPSEVRKQIDDGLAAGGSPPPAGDQAETSTAAKPPAGDRAPLADSPPGGSPTACTWTAPTAGTPAATPTGTPAGTDTGTATGLDLQAALARLWRQAGTPTPNRPNEGNTP